MLASCTHHAPSALGVLGRGDGSCRSEPDAQWCARARARDGHPNGHPGARGFASVYPRRRGSDARTRVAAVRAADPQMQFPRLHCIFISRIEFRLRRNAPPFGQSARHETADTGPHRRTARHPHAPQTPPNTRTGSARHPASMSDGCGLALARAFSRVPSSKCTPRRPSKSLRGSIRGACHLRLFLASPSSCHLDRDQRDARSCFASAAAPLSSTLRTGSSSACMAHRLAALLSRSCCWHLAIMRRLRT